MLQFIWLSLIIFRSGAESGLRSELFHYLAGKLYVYIHTSVQKIVSECVMYLCEIMVSEKMYAIILVPRIICRTLT